MENKHECSENCNHDHLEQHEIEAITNTILDAKTEAPKSSSGSTPSHSPAPNMEEIRKHLKVLQHQKRSEYRLKFNNYENIKKNFKKAFVLQDSRTGLIAEVQAASAIHGCTLLGWNPKRVKFLSTKDIVPETPLVENSLASVTPAIPAETSTTPEPNNSTNP